MTAPHAIAPIQLDGFTNLQEGRIRRAAGTGASAVEFVMERGTARIGLYVPHQGTRHRPQRQDAIYVVLVGNGVFVSGGERRWCEIGDVIFVAAADEHHFDNTSADFELCLMVYGPIGGEGKAAA